MMGGFSFNFHVGTWVYKRGDSFDHFHYIANCEVMDFLLSEFQVFALKCFFFFFKCNNDVEVTNNG